MKHEIMKQLQSPGETRSVRVVFATVAMGTGVYIFDIRHVVHIFAPGTIESNCYDIVMAWGFGTSLLYIYI